MQEHLPRPPFAGFPGQREEHAGSGVTLIGQGDHAACAQLIQHQLQTKLNTEDAHQGQPSLRLPRQLGHKRFLGMSLLYHLTHFLSVTLKNLPFPEPSLQEVEVSCR